MIILLFAAALAGSAAATRMQASFPALPAAAREPAAQRAARLIQVTGYIYDVPGADAASQQEDDPPSHVVFETPEPAKAGLRAGIQSVAASTFRRPRVIFVSYAPGSELEASPRGVPTIRSLFKAIFADHPQADTYTYVNSDIAVDISFVAVADAVAKAVRQGSLRERFLVVGRRTNVDWHEGDTLSDATFGEVLDRGRPFLRTAQDYFMVSQKSFDWDRVPPFIVGNRGYDNWLTGAAVGDPGMDVVDASQALRAMHLTGRYGNSEGFRATSGQDASDYNMKLMMRFNTSLDNYCDDTDAARWVAQMDTAGVVKLVRRSSNKVKLCQERRSRDKVQRV